MRGRRKCWPECLSAGITQLVLIPPSVLGVPDKMPPLPLAPSMTRAGILRGMSGWNNSSLSRRNNTTRGLLSTRVPTVGWGATRRGKTGGSWGSGESRRGGRPTGTRC